MDCLLLLILMMSACALFFRWDLESNSYEIIFKNVNFRDYEFPFQKQQIGITILSLPNKLS